MVDGRWAVPAEEIEEEVEGQHIQDAPYSSGNEDNLSEFQDAVLAF
jgi:hypothetical protein